MGKLVYLAPRPITVRTSVAGAQAAGYITSTVKSREQWTQGSKCSACFLLSYTIQDSLPREWCHPQWVGPPIS